MCCVWHSSLATMPIDLSVKKVYDKIALGCFACVFITIQIVFSIGIVVAYQKIKKIQKREQKFLRTQIISEVDDESDED
jgi:hypothetical protein